MSGGSFRQVEVRCPFYRSDDGRNRIVCEGVGDGRTLTSYYSRGSQYMRQMEVFCCAHYPKCEISRLIMEKY